MEKILEEVGLSTLLQRFMEERIEPEIVLAMTDVELTRLGVTTIGDRVRLRAVCGKTSSECATPTSSSSSSRGPSAASVASERAKLFDPRHSRTGGKKRKATGGRTWTVQVICLADRQQTKIPNSSEKQLLHNAGLGLKKIKFELTDSEQQVADKILSDDKKENNEAVGFPQLRQGGGFELLQCLSNCRELTMIGCQWAVKDLKANLGSQSKIYVRPIQRNLSTKPINPETRAQVKQKCNGCQKEFMMNELRGHMYTCTAGLDDTSSDSDTAGNNNVNQNEQSQHLEQPINNCEQPSNNREQPNNHEQPINNRELPIDNQEQPINNREQPINNHEQPIDNREQPINNYEQPINNREQTSNLHDQVNSTSAQPQASTNHEQASNAILHSTISGRQENNTEQQPHSANSQPTFSRGDIIYLGDGIEGPIDSIDKLNNIVYNVVNYCKENNIASTKEVLRLMQSRVMQGRSLDIESEDTCPDGGANYIMVDRNNLLDTALEEIGALENLFLTLDVQFYGEQAQDYGGPRREFFRLVLLEIKEKYFDHGLRDLLADEYCCVGTLMGLSILQNGKLPQFMSEDIINGIFNINNTSPCLVNLRKGLQKVGIFQICEQMPSLQEIFKPNPASVLTIRKLNTLLIPQFSPVGSNKRRYETAVYTAFCKYIREVAGGRRGNITLAHILQFGTGCDEEPLLGFKLAPSIRFSEVTTSFIPMANTCINAMTLPCTSNNAQLPSNEELWNFYDYAFSNSYFGNL